MNLLVQMKTARGFELFHGRCRDREAMVDYAETLAVSFGRVDIFDAEDGDFIQAVWPQRN